MGCISNHQKIGGAPLNVALRLQSFGNDVAMIRSVGNDLLGKRLLEYIVNNGLNTSLVQIHKSFKTGKVQVTLNDNGSALYDINFPSAWDNILLNDRSINSVKTSDAFVFPVLLYNDTFYYNSGYLIKVIDTVVQAILF